MHALTLAAVVDEVNEKRLLGKPLNGDRRATLCRFVAERQDQPGAYGGLFAPVEGELARGYRFFTGERVTTNAGSRHVLGEEALRALVLMQPRAQSARAAIDRAADWVAKRLDESERGDVGLRARGMFCCMSCSVALWRVFVLDVVEASEDRLRGGLRFLHNRRDGKSAWRSFPFYYTLAALLEIEHDAARAELRYARPAAERRLKRAASAGDDVYARRHHLILERVLA